MSATRQFRGSEWCSALEQFRQATASGESSENVRAYPATTKRIVVHNQFASLERHNSFGKCRPQPRWGVGGWGQGRGRALWDENRPQFILLSTSAISIFLKLT